MPGARTSGDSAAGRSPYQLDLAWDLPIFGAAGAAWLVPNFYKSKLIEPTCPCDSSSLSGFERLAIGHRSALAGTASDWGAGLMLSAPFLLDALDVAHTGGGAGDFASDAAVMLQAIVVNGAVNELFKVGVQRPRPWAYGLAANDPGLSSPDSYTSFYSGHTSAAFAAGMSYAYTYALRHPDSPMRYVVFGGALLGGSAVGALRVATSAHFPSDVIVGAVAGTAIGLGIPWLHQRTDTARLSVAPLPGGAAASLTLELP
ncbi:phosphatase PAP2 family protein [Vulgatibacter incomptus]|uniref:Phosphoesterase PA-phosphatase related protein n=1 Tax=Vulgatibacter incomptus TaxID=1391653 RepID=A0A0K1PAI5_9BACT|nr:phosphatase PAP2 family protein [Vulgatibacter incomptus]AKU90426.1 phosphoesterase PA-phosphatase related protein [Vulgatibacter incomptus]